MNAHPANFEDLTEGLTTKSDKIRTLGRAGVPTSDIARYLGIRYQHARNVLKDAGLQGEQALDTSPENEPEKQRMWLEISPDGSVRLPVAWLGAAGLKSGGQAFVRLSEGVIELRSQKAALSLAQEIVRKYVAPGVSLADELIAERRGEAQREEEEA